MLLKAVEQQLWYTNHLQLHVSWIERVIPTFFLTDVGVTCTLC